MSVTDIENSKHFGSKKPHCSNAQYVGNIRCVVNDEEI